MIFKIQPSSTYVFWYIIKMVSTKLFIIRRCISIEKCMLLCWLVQVFHNPKKFENQSFGVVETTTLKIMAPRSPSMFSASFVCFLSFLSLSLLYLACVFFSLCVLSLFCPPSISFSTAVCLSLLYVSHSVSLLFAFVSFQSDFCPNPGPLSGLSLCFLLAFFWPRSLVPFLGLLFWWPPYMVSLYGPHISASNFRQQIAGSRRLTPV
jgi:hypothetical protein